MIVLFVDCRNLALSLVTELIQFTRIRIEVLDFAHCATATLAVLPRRYVASCPDLVVDLTYCKLEILGKKRSTTAKNMESH